MPLRLLPTLNYQVTKVLQQHVHIQNGDIILKIHYKLGNYLCSLMICNEQVNYCNFSDFTNIQIQNYKYNILSMNSKRFTLYLLIHVLKILYENSFYKMVSFAI